MDRRGTVNRGPFRAVLFDMDGVIIDTERVHQEGWQYACDMQGLKLRRSFVAKLCGANREYQKILFQEEYGGAVDYAAIRKLRQDYCAVQFERDGIPVKTGYRELTDWLREQGIRRALCTSTQLPVAEQELAVAGVPFDFDAAVTGMEPERSKPEPDVFLLGAKKLGVQPEECIVLEDSPNGVRAGFAAGCRVIMIPDTFPATAELRRMAYSVCANLLEARELLITIMGHI